jgi:hypothetical protein
MTRFLAGLVVGAVAVIAWADWREFSAWYAYHAEGSRLPR